MTVIKGSSRFIVGLHTMRQAYWREAEVCRIPLVRALEAKAFFSLQVSAA